MKVLINLIGEQPIPNLLPILFFKPDKTIILYSEKTAKVARRIKRLSKANCEKFEIDAYDLNSINEVLKNIVSKENDYIFNITGGTKLMSVALFNFAAQLNSQIVYLKSENNKNLIYFLKLNDVGDIDFNVQELPELLNVDIYLKAHLLDYLIAPKRFENSLGFVFEDAVVNSLRKNNFEVIQSVKPMGEGQQVEIDAVFRLKGTNNVAIAEIKLGDYKMERPKKGIDQLSTAGSREYLGIYTKKFLITRRKLLGNIKKAAKAHNIIVIDGIRLNKQNKITEDSERYLIQKISENLI